MTKAYGPFSTVSVVALGTRIELSPHLDRWMMGDRYGEVVRFVRKGFRYNSKLGTERSYWQRCKPEFAGAIRVKLDKSGKTITIKADGIGAIL